MNVSERAAKNAKRRATSAQSHAKRAAINKRRRAAHTVMTPEKRERKRVRSEITAVARTPSRRRITVVARAPSTRWRYGTAAAEQQRAEVARLVEKSRSPLSRDEHEACLLLQQRGAYNLEAVKGVVATMKYLVFCATCGGRVHY